MGAEYSLSKVVQHVMVKRTRPPKSGSAWGVVTALDRCLLRPVLIGLLLPATSKRIPALCIPRPWNRAEALGSHI
jgi:hypothetical protein